MIKVVNESTKCKGEAPDGKMICGYRKWCKRYITKDSKEPDVQEFWKAGDDCPQFVSKHK